MFALCGEQVIGIGAAPDVLDFQAGLLAYFAPGAGFKTFSVFQVAARAAPGTSTVGVAPLAEQNLSVAYDNDTDANIGPFVHDDILY